MPDSQQAATGFDWLGREFRNINRKNLPLRIPLAPLERLWFCATPRRQRWECRQWGVEGYPLDVAIETGRFRESVLRCSRGEWAVRSPNHVPPESDGAL